MIGVDTNVLIRLLTTDSTDQHATAVAFFDARSPLEPAFLSAVTVAETIWVLRRSYRFTPEKIGECIDQLMESEDVHIEGRENLRLMLARGFRPAQIADYLITYLSRRAGCTHTITFDRRAAKRVPGMELLT